MRYGLTILIICLFSIGSYSQEIRKYKETREGIKLYLSVHKPSPAVRRNPAIMFFHGGGYNGGNPVKFARHTEYFVSRGLTVINVHYRIRNVHHSTPFQAVSDGKAAMRYVRSHARELGIHPNKIIAAGGSAGGHLAASCALLIGFEGEKNNLKQSCVPDALVLFNPVFKIETEENGGWRGELTEQFPDHSFSPWHNIKKGAPSTIIFLGTEDRLIPVQTAEDYKQKMGVVGSRCELFVYEGQKHGFFNYRENKESPYFIKTVLETDRFLESLGYLKGEPAIEDFVFGELVDPIPQATEALENADNLDIESFERERILAAANDYLAEVPVTVTATSCERSKGGPNDFYSEGDYWWPDPDNPDGPYIRRDGQTNPENFTDHRVAMRNMSIWVPALVAAYKITGEEKYARHAIRYLKAWFVNPVTMMNPNLLYGQAIQGRFTGRGIGIIDTIHLIEVARSIQVLEELGILSGGELNALRNWFREYLEWMTTHPYGTDEWDHGNNHSTWWAVQVAALAKLVGDEDQVEFCRAMYRETLLPGQMSPDGSFEDEMHRTKPYSYSLFNLEAFAMLCELLSDKDHNLWEFELPDGRSIARGLEFMVPYVKDKSSWFNEPDVMYYDEWPVRQPVLWLNELNVKP
ncbi:MAG: alginate lyase family protein [Bacteroidales bacterium]|nr:alginate lyase family protein [Bacteroidales bacterium]